MKYLILVEGSSEKVFIELLIEKGLFTIDENDMIDLKIHQKRQFDTYLLMMIRQLNSGEQVSIIRIGDKLSDKLKVPKDIKHKINSESKYCTKPEFEMLIIISEGLFDEYQKVKSSVKPKFFAKQRIISKGIRYNDTTKWIRNYFYNLDLTEILKEYKQKVCHTANEKYLLDLCIIDNGRRRT